jgi:hypothetical protein
MLRLGTQKVRGYNPGSTEASYMTEVVLGIQVKIHLKAVAGASVFGDEFPLNLS